MANEIMKSLNFGVEIEFTGCKRERAAEIVAATIGGTQTYVGGGYDEWHAKDAQGRTWKVMRDQSIDAGRKLSNGDGTYRKASASQEFKCELVTPILQYSDIETLQEIIRNLRKQGHAYTNRSCGIHIHVGAEGFTPQHLKNISNIFYSQEDLIYKAIECDNAHRNIGYCEKTDESFIKKLQKLPTLTYAFIHYAWYGDNADHSNHHYHSSRYHGLNLHAYYTKKTVEFRCFNSYLHAGKVKSYIQLTLAIAQQALTQTRATAKKRTVSNEKYAFRCWLLRLGLIGDEFATCRKHLLENLDGNCAWKGGKEQADAHREALRVA